MPRQKSQLEKFKEAARELECDDDEKRFADKLEKLIDKSKAPQKTPASTSTKS